MSETILLMPVHVTPKASRNEVAGVSSDAAGRREVQVRVTSAPEGGKANKAVCQVVADALGVPKGRVRVARGDTSRHKQLEVRLREAEEPAARAWLEGLPSA